MGQGLLEAAVALVGVAAAGEFDESFDRHDARAPVNRQGRLIQRVQAELSADLVVSDDQVINGPPIGIGAGIDRPVSTRIFGTYLCWSASHSKPLFT